MNIHMVCFVGRKEVFCKLIEVDKLIEPVIQSIVFFNYIIKIPKYNNKYNFKNIFW